MAAFRVDKIGSDCWSTGEEAASNEGVTASSSGSDVVVRSVAFAVEFDGSSDVEESRCEVVAEEMKEGDG